MIFCLNLFSFQNRLFPEFLLSRISASVPFFANSQFFAEFANLVRFLRRSAKKVPVLDPGEIISDMTRAHWFIPDSHMSTKKSHGLSHDQWKAYHMTIFWNQIFIFFPFFENFFENFKFRLNFYGVHDLHDLHDFGWYSQALNCQWILKS